MWALFGTCLPHSWQTRSFHPTAMNRRPPKYDSFILTLRTHETEHAAAFLYLMNLFPHTTHSRGSLGALPAHLSQNLVAPDNGVIETPHDSHERATNCIRPRATFREHDRHRRAASAPEPRWYFFAVIAASFRTVLQPGHRMSTVSEFTSISPPQGPFGRRGASCRRGPEKSGRGQGRARNASSPSEGGRWWPVPGHACSRSR